MIVRGWQARLYPTREQAARLNQWAGSLRFLWNRLLDREKAAYQTTGKFIWRKALQPIAVGMKRDPETAWLADLPAHAVLDTVARLDGALRRMVAERKAGRKCGFPKAKKKFVRESGIYCVGQATEIGAGEATLPKIGRIKLRGGVIPEGRLLAARVWRDGDRWMLSAQFECARPAPLPMSEVVVGIDLGVSTLVTAFDGTEFEEVAAPKHLRKAMKRLRRAERAKSRRKKGSARRRVQARRVAAIHRKVRERRKDLLHQISHRLTAKAGVLKVETLNVRGMARNRHLALSVADAGISRLVTFCAYKADWRGRRLVEIDRWFPGSQTCCRCGAIHPEMKQLSRDMMICDCGNRMGRDRNAAVNHYSYPEEPGKRGACAPTRAEIGGAGLVPVPVGFGTSATGAHLPSGGLQHLHAPAALAGVARREELPHLIFGPSRGQGQRLAGGAASRRFHPRENEDRGRGRLWGGVSHCRHTADWPGRVCGARRRAIRNRGTRRRAARTGRRQAWLRPRPCGPSAAATRHACSWPPHRI